MTQLGHVRKSVQGVSNVQHWYNTPNEVPYFLGF